MAWWNRRSRPSTRLDIRVTSKGMTRPGGSRMTPVVSSSSPDPQAPARPTSSPPSATTSSPDREWLPRWRMSDDPAAYRAWQRAKRTNGETVVLRLLVEPIPSLPSFRCTAWLHDSTTGSDGERVSLVVASRAMAGDIGTGCWMLASSCLTTLVRNGRPALPRNVSSSWLTGVTRTGVLRLSPQTSLPTSFHRDFVLDYQIVLSSEG